MQNNDETQNTTIFLNRTTHGNTYPGAPLDEEARLLEIPDCELISTLGTGGMGCVYLGRQTQLKRLVAIKALKVNKANDTNFQEWLKKEAVTLGAINHPNIVACYNMIHFNEQLYMVMEYVPGRMSVRKLVKKYGKIPEYIVVHILLETVYGLAYVYQKGYIHRDIKPDNILVYNEKKLETNNIDELFDAPDTRIKICDFGIATKQMDKDSNEPAQIQGSPNYMAPEQITSPDEIDFRADIYALAGTAFYMLTGGKTPFNFKDRDELLAYKLENDIPPVGTEGVHISMAFSRILARMGTVDPDERFESYDELRQALENISTSGREGKGKRKTRFWRVISLLLAVLLFAGTYFYGKDYVVETYFKEKYVSLTGAIGYWKGEHNGWYIARIQAPQKGKIPVLMGDDMMGPLTLTQKLEQGYSLQLQTRRIRPGIVQFIVSNNNDETYELSWYRDKDENSVFSVITPRGRQAVERIETTDPAQWYKIEFQLYKRSLIIFVNDEPLYTGPVRQQTPFELTVNATNAGQLMLKSVYLQQN